MFAPVFGVLWNVWFAGLITSPMYTMVGLIFRGVVAVICCRCYFWYSLLLCLGSTADDSFLWGIPDKEHTLVQGPWRLFAVEEGMCIGI